MSRQSPSSKPLASPFKLAKLDAEEYRQQTRKATWIIIVIFVALAMLLSSLLVMFYGEPGGNNFSLNATGVGAGVVVTVILVRKLLLQQPWMAANVYGWQLKRSLMSITNIMHNVTKGVEVQNIEAMKLLRFYQLGLLQMHQLDGNTGEASQMVHEIDKHKAQMEALGIDPDQQVLDPAWIETVKNLYK